MRRPKSPPRARRRPGSRAPLGSPGDRLRTQRARDRTWLRRNYPGARRPGTVADRARDNCDAADLLAEALAEAGFATRAAYDGPSALTAAGEFAPDIALLDIGLPVMDGYELARRLRESERGKAMRLVAVTGYGQPSDRLAARAAGFDDHFIKPIDLAARASALRR